MKKTLLVIGDLMMSKKRAEPSLGSLMTHKGRLDMRKIGTVFITYDDAMSARMPDIKARKLIVMLFFPYNYWYDQIERYDRDDRIYGDTIFGRKFKEFFLKLDRIIKGRYRDKDIFFINPPLSCAVDRDKKETYRLLKKSNIPTPPIYDVKHVSEIGKILKREKALYLKPRFGAMGKGITYINRKGCYTNFLYKKGRIISRLYDYNWKPVKISDKRKDGFIKKLLKKDFILQKSVETPVHKGRKFDLRVYVVYGKTPYYYAKSAPSKSFITNWSQGGRIEKKGYLKKVLGDKTLRKALTVAKKAAGVINLNYAGVDVIIDKNQGTVYLLEIQSFPGYERGFDLMEFLANAI